MQTDQTEPTLNVEGFTIHVRLPDHPRKGWSKDSLHFHVSLIAPNGTTWDGAYSCGEGCAILAAQDAARGTRPEWEAFAGKRFGGLNGRRRDVRKLSAFGRGRTLHVQDTIEEILKVYRPSASAVLACLFVDACGVSELVDFREWCEDACIEDTNPADALDMYEACKRASLFLRRAYVDQFEAQAAIASEL